MLADWGIKQEGEYKQIDPNGFLLNQHNRISIILNIQSTCWI